MPAESRGIFFLAHSNHYNCFLPVIQTLAAQGRPATCVIPGESVSKSWLSVKQLTALGESAAVRILKRSPFERLQARLWPRYFSRARRWARRVASSMKRLAHPSSVIFIPLHPPNLRHLRDALGSGPRIVCVQHDPYLALGPGESLADFPVDLFCVWGDHMKGFLERHDARAPIVICGAPHLTRKLGRPPAGDSSRELSLLYATQPTAVYPGARGIPVEMKRRAIRDLVTALRELPRLRLTIKLHPNDDGRIEAETMAAATDLVERASLVPHERTVPIEDHINASDLVVTIHSTVAFEGIVRNRPVVLLNYDGVLASISRRLRSERDYLSEGSAVEARDAPSLLAALRTSLYDRAAGERLRSARERFLAKHIRYDCDEAVTRILKAAAIERRPHVPNTPPAA